MKKNIKEKLESAKGWASFIALMFLFFVVPIVGLIAIGNGLEYFFSTEIGSVITDIITYIILAVAVGFFVVIIIGFIAILTKAESLGAAAMILLFFFVVGFVVYWLSQIL